MMFESLYDKKRCATESGVGVGICFAPTVSSRTARNKSSRELSEQKKYGSPLREPRVGWHHKLNTITLQCEREEEQEEYA